MHEVLVNRLGGLSLPRKSVVRLTDRPDVTLDVYRGRKTTNQQIIHSDKTVHPYEVQSHINKGFAKISDKITSPINTATTHNALRD